MSMFIEADYDYGHAVQGNEKPTKQILGESDHGHHADCRLES